MSWRIQLPDMKNKTVNLQAKNHSGLLPLVAPVWRFGLFWLHFMPKRRSRFSEVRSTAQDISYQPCDTVRAVIGNVPFIHSAAAGDFRHILSMLSHVLYCLLCLEKETL